MNSNYIPLDVTTEHGAHSNMSPFPKMVIKYQVAEFFNILYIVVSGNNAEMYKFTIKTIYTVQSLIEHWLLTAICSSISKVAVNINNI